MSKSVTKTGKTSILPWILAGIAALTGGVLFMRTNANKLLNMADFKLTGVKIKQVKVLNTTITTNILVNNPSDLVVNLTALRVEFLRLANGKKEILATSPTTKLLIPKNGNIAFNVNFDISNAQVLSMASGAIQTGIESQLKGKISIRIKCEVMGQYIEKEIPYL
jgi:LEA14-like dessication related protein